MTLRQVPICSAIFLLLTTLSFTACSSSPPEPINARGDWLDYADQRAGYSIKYPAKYRLVPGGNGEVAFRGEDKKIAYRISIATFDEAKKRGLWVSTEPIGTTYVSGGFTAHRYVYSVLDGTSKEHRAAFVLDREGKMLALEFHIAGNNSEGTLDDGQMEVLKSFTIL
jgi:hypothetical protein